MRVCEQCGRTFGADETVCPDDQTELSAYTDELIGTNVDRYVLVRRLGRGAMGTIYLGVHPVIRSRVAIKILNTAAEEDSSGFSRFVTEARSVNEIQHPNIVRIADFDQLADGRPYFVMEYLAGDSLRERMTREPRLSPEEAGEIVKQILEALQAAHDAGFVHRDLKPDNIFITSDGVVKLLDFGIAKLLDSPGKSFETQAGVVIGTPMYISPEQALGDHSRVGPWTDLYSLGVILYELYTGRSPFNVKTVGRLLMAHIQDSPIPPSAQCIEVSGALEKAILRCLEKEPEDRPQSATELLAEFTAASTEYVDVVSQTLPGSTLPQYDNPLFEEATRQASETDGPGDLQRVDASEIVPGARSSARGQLTGPISSSPRVPSPPARSALRIGTIVVTIAALIAVAFWSYRAFLTKGSSRIKKAPAPTASKPRLAPRAQPRGKLVVLQPFQADYISPMKVTNAEGFDIVMQTHEPLVSYEALTGQIHAMLAVKWQRTAQGYTFELRKGVRFHDGAPLTAKEAVRSLKAAVKSKLGSAYLSDVVEIKATGEMFLTIKVKQHSATFLVRLSRYPSFIGRPGRRFPVGTGPYRVRLWNKRIGAVMLEPFVGYWGGAPKLQSIVFKAEPDAVARASHLVQGSAHLATALPTHVAQKLEPRKEIEVIRSAQNFLAFLMFNTKKPHLRDPRIRQALSMAVDRERLVRELYKGSASLAGPSVPPGLLRISESNRVRYEPKKAQKLLAKTPIAKRTLTLYMYSDARPYMPLPKLAAKILRQGFAAAGIKVRTVLLPYTEAKQACQRGKHDMAFFGWGLDYPDPENVYFLISRKGTGAGWNFAHFDDDEFERLLSAVEVEPDYKKRLELFRKMEAIVAAKRPWLPLAYVAVFLARRSEVKGVFFDFAGDFGIDLRKAYFARK